MLNGVPTIGGYNSFIHHHGRVHAGTLEDPAHSTGVIKWRRQLNQIVESLHPLGQTIDNWNISIRNLVAKTKMPQSVTCLANSPSFTHKDFNLQPSFSLFSCHVVCFIFLSMIYKSTLTSIGIIKGVNQSPQHKDMDTQTRITLVHLSDVDCWCQLEAETRETFPKEMI